MASIDTKGKIIKEMFELIAEQGYEKASIGKIAERVGIKKASIYYYYRRKEDILFDVIDTYIDVKQFDAAFHQIHNHEAYKCYLQDFGMAIIDDYVNNAIVRKVCSEIQLLCSRDEDVKQKMLTIEANHRSLFEAYFEHGMQIKVLPEDFQIQINAQLLNVVFTGIDSILMTCTCFDAKAIWIHLINQIL